MSTTTLEHRGLRTDLADRHPCGTRVRYVGGCRCDACRQANTQYERDRAAARRAGDWNGIVCARMARTHLARLARQGVGRRAVAAATDIPESILASIRAGKRLRIRARTERKILAVTRDQASDRALIPAGPTWVLIERLIRHGYSEERIAAELGYSTTRLQLGRDRVTARNAHRVKVLHERLTR